MSAATASPPDLLVASDWESPTGPLEESVNARCEGPSFVYRGYDNMHWLGQPCHIIGAGKPDERLIVLACGCRASVPWWTLESSCPCRSR